MNGTSLFFGNRLNKILRKPDDGKGGEGGGGEGNKPDPAKELADIKAQNAALQAKLAELEKNKPNPPPNEDPDLKRKAELQREADDKARNNIKATEAAIAFNMNSEKFLKDNAALLPKEVAGIFEQSNKENYNSHVEKSAAIKSGVIQSFFSVQENLDLLTPALKSQLEDYLKLTNTGKADKASQVWDNIFEPTFENLRKLRKADALKNGRGSGEDDEYKKKLIEGSTKHYLGVTK